MTVCQIPIIDWINRLAAAEVGHVDVRFEEHSRVSVSSQSSSQAAANRDFALPDVVDAKITPSMPLSECVQNFRCVLNEIPNVLRSSCAEPLQISCENSATEGTLRSISLISLLVGSYLVLFVFICISFYVEIAHVAAKRSLKSPNRD